MGYDMEPLCTHNRRVLPSQLEHTWLQVFASLGSNDAANSVTTSELQIEFVNSVTVGRRRCRDDPYVDMTNTSMPYYMSDQLWRVLLGNMNQLKNTFG